MLAPLAALAAPDVINLAYLLAAVLFIFGLKMLSSVKTAARGNLISALGMLVAVCVTFVYITGPTAVSLIWVAIAMAIGGVVGYVLAVRVPMTGMPQMVALLNGFGGLASLLVACGDYFNTWFDIRQTARPQAELVGMQPVIDAAFNWHVLLAVGLAALVGGVTFTGSFIAFGKLQGGALSKIAPSHPVQFPGQKVLIALLLLVCLVLTGVLIAEPAATWAVWSIAILSLVLGILLVIGIGGADMPVVVSLLNSYSGIAAAMAGFVLGNQALIITGALVGASGLILTNIMCKAMNRSLANVLFGGVGAVPTGSGGDTQGITGDIREVTAEDVGIQLDAAQQVMIVPGYGMAVAQAQHAVADLAQQLEDRGIKVYYAIHPVAGRMPGHMNVLLAEANIPYDHLLDLDSANAEFEQTDVAVVIGANDVINPAARHSKSSPIYGMPILDVDKARSVIVIKRSMNPGFAGVENELFYAPNTSMLFGDAKTMVNQLVGELKEAAV